MTDFHRLAAMFKSLFGAVKESRDIEKEERERLSQALKDLDKAVNDLVRETERKTGT